MPSAKRIVARGLATVGLDSIARTAWQAAMRARYYGDRYECPVCSARLKAFLPGGEPHAVLIEKSVIGGGPRANVLCPACGAFDRERLVFLYLKNNPELLGEGAKILHVAPESHLRPWLRSRPGIGYITADLGEGEVDMNFDLVDIPLPDASFDGMICNHVLEHVPDDAKAMSEILRVLKPGGWAILQTPISTTLADTYEDFSIAEPADRERAFGQHDHVRIYAKDDYVRRLTRAGLQVEVFEWPSSRSRYGGETNRFGLIENELLFFCRRPS